MTKSLTSLFMGILYTGVLFCQDKTVSRSQEVWLQYNNQTKLSEKWTLFGSTSARWKDGFDEFILFLGRVGASYTMSDRFEVAAGFVYAESYAEKQQLQAEFRPYEELLIRDTGANKIKLNQRIRFEQRFYNSVVDGKIESDNTFALRFRYALMTGFTLFHLSKTNPDALFRINVTDEIMFNAGKDIVYNVFDKNRFIIGPSIQFNKWISASVTWNSQFATSSSGPGRYNYTDVIWVHLTHTIDLSKKKLRG